MYGDVVLVIYNLQIVLLMLVLWDAGVEFKHLIVLQVVYMDRLVFKECP
jgi:hypothetical protein